MKEETAKEEYLKSGKVPFSYAVKRGLRSLFLDPSLFIVSSLPGPLGFAVRQRLYRPFFQRMGKGVLVDPQVRIQGFSNISVDDFSYLGWGLELHATEGSIQIGKRCHLTGWILGHEGVSIGDYVACGGSLLSATDSHHEGHRMAGSMIPMEQRNLRRGKIVVEKDAFISRQTVIMPGVTIGEGAVVAPFSTVVGKVKPWTVVSGTPARQIGMRDEVKFPDPD